MERREDEVDISRLSFLILVCLLLGLVVMGCSGQQVMVDRSTEAFAAKDLTLISSCQSAPATQISLASGVAACRFTVGDAVAGAWTLITPPPTGAKQVTGGTIDTYFLGQHKSFPITGWATQIPFVDITGAKTWTSLYDETVAEALVLINWVDTMGIARISRYRGIAVLIVTALGYDRMPIDSGNSAWGTECRAQYSTAGRSAFQCK